MPIKIPNTLPAVEVLNRENIFIMREARADAGHPTAAHCSCKPHARQDHNRDAICAATEQHAAANRS